MKIGIIGPPQSGKTTVFKVLIETDVSGSLGVFKVVDRRLEKLSEAMSSRKITYPEFIFVDLGPTSEITKKALQTLQDIDMFLCVIGAFFSEDPKGDLENSLTDIIISDLEFVQNRMLRLQKEQKRPESAQELELLERCQSTLSEGRFLSELGLSERELRLFSGLTLLSLRPLLVVINISDEVDEVSEDRIRAVENYCSSRGIGCIRFFGKIETELLELEKSEREKFLNELGGYYDFKTNLSKSIIQQLRLITFFTVGEKEARAWHLRVGLPVIEAAGKIHTDMKRGFIRAEVVNYEDFVRLGSIHKAREAGLLKIEGRDYIVKDGDIINIRFNV